MVDLGDVSSTPILNSPAGCQQITGEIATCTHAVMYRACFYCKTKVVDLDKTHMLKCQVKLKPILCPLQASAKFTIIEADYLPCPCTVNVNVFKDIILKLISKSPHQLASTTSEDIQHELATARNLSQHTTKTPPSSTWTSLAQSFVHMCTHYHIEPLTVLLHFTITHTFW